MRRSIEIFSITILLSAGALAAQEPALETGSRVRIQAAGSATSLTGTLLYRDESQVALALSSADTAVVPLSDIARIDVSAGRRSNAIRGARAGAIVGGGIGAMLGIYALNAESTIYDFQPDIIPVFAAGGALLAGTAGLIIGSLWSSERWEMVPAPITIAPQGGPNLSIGFSF